MTDYELVIVGAGPGGISMAVEAMEAGIEKSKILVLEKYHEHSWSIRKFYPEQKLVAANYKGQEANCLGRMCLIDSTKNETLSYLDEIIAQNQIAVHYEESVYKIEKTESGFIVCTNNGCYNTKICVVAIGIMGKPNRPDWKIGPEIKDRVHFDITTKEMKNSQILVVGGGDSAAEYAQYLLQSGNRVSLSYRRHEFSRMNDMNLNILKDLESKKEIDILYGTNIKEVKNSGDQLEVIFEQGQTSVHCDNLVLALGGSTPKNFLAVLGIEFEGADPYLTEGYETSVPGLFLVGDLSAGRRGGSIISAFNSSHKAMQKICENYLQCKI